MDGADQGDGLSLEELPEGGQLFCGASGVEPPLALFEEQPEGRLGHAVELPQVPLGLVPEVLDPVDVPAVRLREGLLMVDLPVMMALDRERIAARPGVRVAMPSGWTRRLMIGS